MPRNSPLTAPPDGLELLSPSSSRTAKNIFIFGSSHTVAAREAFSNRSYPRKRNFQFLNPTDFGSDHEQLAIDASGNIVMNPDVFCAMKQFADDQRESWYFSMIGGIDHYIFGLLQHDIPYNFIVSGNDDTYQQDSISSLPSVAGPMPKDQI